MSPKKSDSNNLPIPAPNYEIIKDSGADGLLQTVRPVWKGRKLIDRVERLLLVDPSSACQRIFNAAVQDLREKLRAAGIDIVGEIARQNKLPPVQRGEDLDDYTAHNTIELAYRVGIISRPESKRMFRVYDIRGDLEHEDDEYEATAEDVIYVFKTCVEAVLSKDPTQILSVIDIKKDIEQPQRVAISEAVVADYAAAPHVRQLEIHRFLVSHALNGKVPDVVRENAYAALGALREVTRPEVLLDAAKEFVERVGRAAPDLLHARVAHAAGVFPYLKKVQRAAFFQGLHDQMAKVGYTFRSHGSHRELLQTLADVGGLEHCPAEQAERILEWLVLLYIGEPGGYGMGVNRKVFYSNVGAPLALARISDDASMLGAAFELVGKSKLVRSAITDSDVARRYEEIVDVLTPK